MKKDSYRRTFLEDFLFNKSDPSDSTGEHPERRVTEESSEKANLLKTENKLNDNVAEIREIIKTEVGKAFRELQRAGRYSRVRRWRKRKNQRVVYVPKDPVVQGVLERLQDSTDEPLRVTLRKVFEVAAKHLNLR